MGIEQFTRKSLSELAAQLDVHPFDLARYLSLRENGMPAELMFDSKDGAMMAQELRLEAWWKEPFQIEDNNHKRLLIRELASRLLQADLSESTRADNLVRGLTGADFDFVRKAINALILSEILESIPKLTGVELSLSSKGNVRERLQKIVDAQEFPEAINEILR